MGKRSGESGKLMRAQAGVTSPPYVIGLTGNIATGKTTVGQLLVELGAELIDADKVAHVVMAPDGPAYAAIIDTFGQDIVDADGTIMRHKLGKIVFDDPEALRRLEAIVHPAVIADIRQRIATSTSDILVVEAIKLLESGMAADYEAIWVTVCTEDQQLTRLMQIRGLDRTDALRRIHAQPPQSEKIARADIVINTEGTLEATRDQVIAAWKQIPRVASHAADKII